MLNPYTTTYIVNGQDRTKRKEKTNEEEGREKQSEGKKQ
jgi:hypothetical protein